MRLICHLPALYANKHQHHWDKHCFLHKGRKNFMLNVCRIYSKDQIVENLLQTFFSQSLLSFSSWNNS